MPLSYKPSRLVPFVTRQYRICQYEVGRRAQKNLAPLWCRPTLLASHQNPCMASHAIFSDNHSGNNHSILVETTPCPSATLAPSKNTTPSPRRKYPFLSVPNSAAALVVLQTPPWFQAFLPWHPCVSCTQALPELLWCHPARLAKQS
ncbi:hypothetical protein METBIDRAFT_169905 [Metschnikowia bicuspidata var. bicuspidata NRRL YB-4993]|uniref:Uncharacterized protein n=1 Tax=Metschnikowia bicuspidata var. bicuspidata NRRL YB-4993 TaxID=869754 RepID=A0A1A0HAQ0_9ASCO|nr:hypothetical protein METBIDRAFT_169905 [Metschnikowia bicuspidata var. bicuspidata NRRL YB-4993]OBA20958.1 hypothetical protein METBIDRAFT_169905 [Metschnikowia bicuspidata var. bicuspidata NRRL YB-4993]